METRIKKKKCCRKKNESISVEIDPKDLQTMLGYVRYQVTVQSASGSMGAMQYTLSITFSWRKLDPDWGTRENLDVIETYLEGSTGSGDPVQ